MIVEAYVEHLELFVAYFCILEVSNNHTENHRGIVRPKFTLAFLEITHLHGLSCNKVAIFITQGNIYSIILCRPLAT